jgi:hypothetical protein
MPSDIQISGEYDRRPLAPQPSQPSQSFQQPHQQHQKLAGTNTHQLLTTYRMERQALSIDDPTDAAEIRLNDEFNDRVSTRSRRSVSFPFVNNIPNFYRNELMEKYYVPPQRSFYNLTTRVLESNPLMLSKFPRREIIRTVRMPNQLVNDENFRPHPVVSQAPSNALFQLKRVSDQIINSSQSKYSLTF